MDRHRKLLDVVLCADIRRRRSETEQSSVGQYEIQQWIPSVEQEHPEPPHIKEEQEEVWSSQEGEQLEGLKEAEITKFPYSPVPGKTEDEGTGRNNLHLRVSEEKGGSPQSGGPGVEQLPESKEEELESPHIKEEQEQLWTTQTKSAWNFNLDPDGVSDSSELKNDVSDDDDDNDSTEKSEPQSLINSLKIIQVPATDVRCKKTYSCSECGKIFGRSPHLKIHLRTHTGEKPFSCPFCAKRFTQKVNLTYHMSVHTGEKRFICRFCHQRFTWYTQLKSHLCVCESSLLHQSRTVETRETETGDKSFSCSECGKIFSRKDNLNIHVRIHTGERPFSCSVCSKSFKHGGHLTQHMSVHTKENRFSCRVCDRKFTWLYQLKRHTCGGESSQSEVWSSQGGEQLEGQEEAEITKFPFSPVPVKTEDNEEKPQPSQLHQSQTEDNRDSDRGSEPRRTLGPGGQLGPGTDGKSKDFCGYKFKVSYGGQKEISEPESGGKVSCSGCHPVKKSFTCSECGKIFRRKEHLQTHVRIHTGERPFSCSDCGKTFGCKRSLLGHMTSHSGEKPFSCSQCGKRFGRMVNLKTHQRLHTGERPFSCPFCGKGFTQKVHMTQHVAIHTGEKQFSCSICGKKFTWLSGFRRHKCGSEQSELDDAEENSEVEPGEKRFRCRECGNRFNHKHNLKAHVRIHTGEKPFSCSVCAKGFLASGALKKHLRTHSGEKPFGCSVCGIRFTQGGNLKRHMAQHAGGTRQKPFSCSVCGKSFTQVSNMKRHMLQHNVSEIRPSQEAGGKTVTSPESAERLSLTIDSKPSEN